MYNAISHQVMTYYQKNDKQVTTISFIIFRFLVINQIKNNLDILLMFIL